MRRNTTPAGGTGAPGKNLHVRINEYLSSLAEGNTSPTTIHDEAAQLDSANFPTNRFPPYAFEENDINNGETQNAAPAETEVSLLS